MTEYLSKEEIKQWRSSLEKITLEEFAARLGKKVEEEKSTNDLIDIIYSGESVSSNVHTNEKLSKIAERAMVRERQLSHTPFSFRAPETENKEVVESKKPVVDEESQSIVNSIKKVIEKEEVKTEDLREEVDIVLKKNLTDREQLVFDYLLEHKNTTVYAKDLAVLLDLPRDYIYKYIKNLRSKIEGDRLKNATKGGFILSV